MSGEAWWPNTKKSFTRLMESWAEADEETRWDFGFWLFGLGAMAFSIIAQFGFAGLGFCGGYLIWWGANAKLRP